MCKYPLFSLSRFPREPHYRPEVGGTDAKPKGAHDPDLWTT